MPKAPVKPITPIESPVNSVSLSDLQKPTSITEAPPVQLQDFNQFVDRFAADTTSEKRDINDNRSNITNIGRRLATRGDRASELDADFELPAQYQQAADLNTQIAELAGAFNTSITNEEGEVRPIEFITGRQAFLQRQKATQLEALSAVQAALTGNIALAEQRVETALEREFGDLEALLESEMFDLQENKEAMTSKDAKATEKLEQALAERGRQLEERKEQRKQVLNYATEAASNGAPNSLTARIAQAQTAEEALSLSSGYVGLLDRQQKQAQIRSSIANANKNEYELTVIKQAADDRAEAIREGRLLPEQAEVVDDIDKEFRSEPVVKEYNEAVARRFAFEEILENGVSGVQDMQLVYDFMKSVDPTSVVRESEFDNAAKSGNIFAGAYTKFNKGYFGEGGILPEGVKQSFTDASNAAYEGKQQQYFNVKDNFGIKVDRRLGTEGGEKYLTAYEDGAPGDRTASETPEDAEEGTIVEYRDEDGLLTRYRKLPNGDLIEL